MYIHIHIYIYIYVRMYRERKRERERYICTYTHIYEQFFNPKLILPFVTREEDTY